MTKIKVGNKELQIKDYHCAFENGHTIKKNKHTLWLYVNITDICNGNCPFCVNPSKKTGSNQFDLNKFKNILSSIKDVVEGVSITGGEPMLYPELIDEVIQIVNEEIDHPVEINVVTNGTNFNKILSLNSLDNIESIHISRHCIKDEDNSKLMGLKTPDIQEIKGLISQMNDPAKIVLNCVMQKQGVSNQKQMKEYLMMACDAGIRNVSFIGFFMANDYCRDNYVNPSMIDLTNDHSFEIFTHFRDYNFCSCYNGTFKFENQSTRFYLRCPGNCKASYVRQLVYTADNRLLAGFGGEEIDL